MSHPLVPVLRRLVEVDPLGGGVRLGRDEEEHQHRQEQQHEQQEAERQRPARDLQGIAHTLPGRPRAVQRLQTQKTRRQEAVRETISPRSRRAPKIGAPSAPGVRGGRVSAVGRGRAGGEAPPGPRRLQGSAGPPSGGRSLDGMAISTRVL